MPTTASNSVDTVNAAAAAIVTAESRVQPVSSQKRRWGSCWNLYWCFGPLKSNNKKISHAALVPEPDVTEQTLPVPDNPNPSTSAVLPFIAPPSSPLPLSDPPTGTHSPVGLLAVTPLSINRFSSSQEAHIFAIGPYAHETQLVSPPVFSAFTTEPSTAAITPPPEPMQFTTPSSPEVPFAQLLTSSLNRARRNSGTHHKFALSCYELHHLISPGSANSASGTSSPYLDKRPVLEFRMIDASKIFDSKKFYTRKWGSRLGSGSVTPDGQGFASNDGFTPENQISESTSLAHRVSFELSHEDGPKCQEKKIVEITDKHEVMPLEEADRCKLCDQETSRETHETPTEYCRHKRTSFSLGSVKEFDFDNSEQETPAKPNPTSEWWADETVVRDIEAEENWSFYPLVQPGVS
ncbi:hypothetical protein RND81_05G090600 [Saponaria officinalis]|uniref:Uncharacterized protein n=1 Tax=Saponaria officinalis TaxID=3572 RepID=A0AAW1KYY0_SAPOF